MTDQNLPPAEPVTVEVCTTGVYDEMGYCAPAPCVDTCLPGLDVNLGYDPADPASCTGFVNHLGVCVNYSRVFIPIEPHTERCLVTSLDGSGTTDLNFFPCNAATYTGESVWPDWASEPVVVVSEPPAPTVQLPETGIETTITLVIASVLILVGSFARKVANH